MSEIYDDEYDTCQETHASLRLIHDDLEPESISSLLGVRPTWAWRKGEARSTRRRKVPSPVGIWLLSSEYSVKSRDVRRHIDWLLDQIQGKEDVIKHLQSQGYEMDVWCLWISTPWSGGGPTISPYNMRRLADFGIELAFDYYTAEADEEERKLRETFSA